MKDKQTKAERDQLHPLVVVNEEGLFLQGRRWITEYPDADKFKPNGERNLARQKARKMNGKVVGDFGLTTQYDLADYIVKPWRVTADDGKAFDIPDCTPNEIPETLSEFAPKGTKIVSTARTLYDNGKRVSQRDMDINSAVRSAFLKTHGYESAVLHLTKTIPKYTRDTGTGRDMVLLSNNGKAPFILPAVINGAVEYQVSDGMDGRRGTSYDAYTFTEAMANFNKMKRDGVAEDDDEAL